MKLLCGALAVAALAVTVATPAAHAQTRTGWEMHRGLESGPFAYPYDDLVPFGTYYSQHGAVGMHQHAGPIPSAGDPGWGPAPTRPAAAAPRSSRSAATARAT